MAMAMAPRPPRRNTITTSSYSRSSEENDLFPPQCACGQCCEKPCLQCYPAVADSHSATLCMVLVLAGFNDGSQGPLLPFLQDYYHVCLHSRSDG